MTKNHRPETNQGMDEPLQTADVHGSERAYHDRIAAEECETEEEIAAARNVAERALKLMQIWDSLPGSTVLECGCGTGRLTELLAKRAAKVYGFDISPDCVNATKRRAELYGINNLELCACSMEEMPYEPESFDIVTGFFILHHLADLEVGIQRVAYVLKPGGVAVFAETSARNRILMFCRDHLAGRFGIPKIGTPDEHPLTREHLNEIAASFPGDAETLYPHFRFFGKFYFQIMRRLGMRKVNSRTERCCEGIDRLLQRCFPFLTKYSYVLIVKLTKATEKG
jgi:ubiquinone/menaquinone biosynthesis C-methylase UbiE